jgi:hypothetical protein
MKKMVYPLFLLLVNAAIIVATQVTGGGTWFAESGVIHLLALIFCGLSVITIFKLRHLEGEVFMSVFKSFLAALVLFSFVHVLEFVVNAVPNEGLKGVADLIVIILYAMGLVQISDGYKNVLLLRKTEDDRVPQLPGIMLLVLALICLVVYMIPALEDAKPFLPVMMLFFTIPLAINLVHRGHRMVKLMPMLTGFMQYMRLSFLLIAFASAFEFLESVQISAIPEEQMTYFAHYAFYAAISLQLLGFSTLFTLGGIYEELRLEKKKTP